jgi:hypothetical protein
MPAPSRCCWYRHLNVVEPTAGLLAVGLDQALHELVDVAGLGQVALVQQVAQLWPWSGPRNARGPFHGRAWPARERPARPCRPARARSRGPTRQARKHVVSQLSRALRPEVSDLLYRAGRLARRSTVALGSTGHMYVVLRDVRIQAPNASDTSTCRPKPLLIAMMEVQRV